MNKQFQYNLPWHCPVCEAKGVLGFNDDSDIGLISMSIELHHRKKSPQCSCWYSNLKVGWSKEDEHKEG